MRPRARPAGNPHPRVGGVRLARLLREAQQAGPLYLEKRAHLATTGWLARRARSDRGPEAARQHLLLLADASVYSDRRCEDPTMGFPEPADLTSLVVRTDFSDDGAWRNLQAAIDETNEYPVATYVSDPEYANVAVRTLVDIDAVAESKAYYLFLADTIAMSAPGWPLLAVDLADEPGRTFRVPARWYGDVSANLCIANLDFADFADAADDSGTYRGSDRDEEHRVACK